jgi:hypothetical protein
LSSLFNHLICSLCRLQFFAEAPEGNFERLPISPGGVADLALYEQFYYLLGEMENASKSRLFDCLPAIDSSALGDIHEVSCYVLSRTDLE